MKSLLLALSNLRKSKSQCIGIGSLILVLGMMINLVLILFLDYIPNYDKQAQALNTSDSIILASNQIDKLSEDNIKKLLGDSVLDYEYNIVPSRQIEVEFGSGKVTVATLFNNAKIADTKYNKAEISLEDSSISSNYIYLPYLFYTGGNYKLGDTFTFEIKGKAFELTVKGFINEILLGASNGGAISTIVDDITYQKIKTEYPEIDSVKLSLVFKDGHNKDKETNRISSEITKLSSETSTGVILASSTKLARTYMALIIGVSFLVVTIIIIIVILLMISNNVSNYIKDNITTIGALKAMGYVSKEIKLAFIYQFLILTIASLIPGVFLTYAILPVIFTLLTSQHGIPYSIHFAFVPAAISIIGFIIIITLMILFFVRKIKNIEPINALRNGLEVHNFKKNRISLEKPKLHINLSLSLKTLFNNIKQNIATFLVVFFLMYCGVLSLVMYENFSRNPKLSMMSFELCSGAYVVQKDSVAEVNEYVSKIDGVSNIRLVSSLFINDGDARINAYIIDDSSKLTNKDTCYKGRLPRYDNEVALSGVHCKNYGYSIGDSVLLHLGDVEKEYLITGLIQTTNNLGKEAVLTKDGFNRFEQELTQETYFFDLDEKLVTEDVLNNIKNTFGDKIVVTADFKKTFESAMSTFVSVSNLMVVVISIICAVVIFLVLYLLMKTLINNKKKDYGILKALGYTSKDVIIQNSLSFMPTIIVSTIISAVVASFIANPYLELMLSFTGIMKCSMTIPVGFVVIFSFAFILLSLLFTFLLSLKIKKIEPYNLLIQE